MTTGQIIEQIMQERGIKKVWLAKRLDIPSSTLSTKLKQDIPFSLLLKICEELKITVEEVSRRLEECQQNKETN